MSTIRNGSRTSRSSFVLLLPLKKGKLQPPPATPSVIQMKPFTEICATLGLDEVALFYETRDFSGGPLLIAELYLVYHTKDDRVLGAVNKCTVTRAVPEDLREGGGHGVARAGQVEDLPEPP